MPALSPAPAGGTLRANAPSVGLLSLSEPCASGGYADGVVVNDFLIGALAWWRYESLADDEGQVWFDAMRTIVPDDDHVFIVLLDQHGAVIKLTRNGTDPVDGPVFRGAVLSPFLKPGDVVYIAIGQGLGDPVAPDDPVDMTYRLRVSGQSTYSDWIELPDRDRTAASPGQGGNDAPLFSQTYAATAPWPDPGLPYLPRPNYRVGFQDSFTSWNGHAQVFDLSVLSRFGNSGSYDGGGPYGSPFQGGTAYACLEAATVGPGKWNAQGDKWGGYWRDYCPPPLATDRAAVGGAQRTSVYMRMEADNSKIIVTDPDSINLEYHCPVYAFNLHQAQEALGPSGGWLTQNEMQQRRRQDAGLFSEIVWERDRCEILDVVAIRSDVNVATTGYDRIDPAVGSGAVPAPSASWRGGAARVPRPGVNLWGPYVEPGQVFEDGERAYDVTVYGSAAGPESVPLHGPAVFDHGHENPATSVLDWREAYAFEEARASTWTDRAGQHTLWGAPGLVWIVTGDGFSQFSVDPSSTPAGHSFSLEITISGLSMAYQIAVRPSRFRFRDEPLIPAATVVTTDPPWVRALQRTDGLDVGGPPRAVQHTSLRSGIST